MPPQTSALIQSIRLEDWATDVKLFTSLLSSLSHMSFVFVKNEFFECELNGVAARRWYANPFRKLDLELARLPK
jgi:hypothetical protein